MGIFEPVLATPFSFIFSSKVFSPWFYNFTLMDRFFSLTVEGLNDRDGRGRWEWAGGEPVSYTNWRKTPSRSKMKGNKRCVQVWRRAKWQVRDCKRSIGHRFVCSIKTWTISTMFTTSQPRATVLFQEEGLNLGTFKLQIQTMFPYGSKGTFWNCLYI